MRTEDLIRAMAADTTRARPVAVSLTVAVLATMAVVAAFFLPMMGARPDLAAAVMHLPVMVKQAFPVLLAVGAFGAALRLARPGTDVGGWVLILAGVAVLLGLAVAETLAVLPPDAWMPAMMGQSNGQCVGFISVMSLPLLAGALWALRSGASTRPALTGAIAGLLSGAAAAIVYSLHCTEDSPLFYSVWYMVAILAATLAGTLLGQRVLRW
jgi:hypothetical protein